MTGCNGPVTRDFRGKKCDSIASVEAVFAVRNDLPALGALRGSESPIFCALRRVTGNLAGSRRASDHRRVVPSIMGDRR